jgi:hypothetical protein
MTYWSPQLGPQFKAATCPVDFPFFGGSRGGGKSDCLLGRQIRGAEKYGRYWNGLIIRRKYKELNELRRRVDELKSDGLPFERTGGDIMTNHLKFSNGAHVQMVAINSMDQVNDYIGHQFTEIGIDECTTFPFFSRMVDKLKGSNRSPHGVPCRMFGTGNPGGPGHNDVKEFFKLGKAGVKPETVMYDDIGESRIFIPSFLKDNRILIENDPKYVRRLLSIRDPMLKKAWIDGDWDVYIGQAFGFYPQYHVIKPLPIPQYATIYFTFDWGYARPYSIGYWWVDADGRIYRFSEIYGWSGMPDEGVRLEDSKIAEQIREHEIKLNINNRKILRYCDPTSFNKKPDYKGGGQGPSTASVFAEHGIIMMPGDASRELKIRQFRERLALPENKTEKPMMLIYEDCKHFIRTIPGLSVEETNPEDIDTDQEDHVYDEACHICMARPLKLVEPPSAKSEVDRRIDLLEQGEKGTFQDYALREQIATQEYLKKVNLYPTIMKD